VNHPDTRTSMSRRVRRRFVGLIAVTSTLVVASLGGVSPAGAHTGDQSYLYIDITETAVSGRVEAPIRDLNTALGLDLNGETEEVEAGIQENQDRIFAYLDDHLDIGADGTVWPLTFTSAELFFSDLPEEDDNYALFFFEADVTGTIPRDLEVTFDPFFDEIPGRDALLLIGNDWQAGVIENGNEVAATFDGGSRSQVIDLGNTGWVKNLTASTKLGVNHIKTGPDHILFVLVLLLPSVLVFSTRWRPTPSFGSSLWRVLKIVTMFTVAHSITFSLAGLEVLPLPSERIVESIIAISIAAAAIHNIRPLAPNKEWLIAFGFGLFHGMGFASLVSGLDVARSTQMVSLLGRNIGIEIGQAMVVLLLFPGLFLLRRTRYFHRFFVVMSVLLAVISIGWMLERLFEVELGVSAWVDPLVEFPRVLVFVALFTLVAAGLNWFEGNRKRLLPVFEPGATAQPDQVVGAV
jgi:hypothetical protein